MKKISTTAIILCVFSLFNCLKAQLADVMTGTAQVTSVYVNGNDLYFGNFIGELSKADIASGQPATTILQSNGIYRSAIAGNDLYVTENNDNQITKLDISQSPPLASTIASNLNSPFGIVIKGDTLYYTEPGGGLVLSLDITQSNPTPVVVAAGFGQPLSLAMRNNELYVADWDNSSVYKLDVTSSSPRPITVVSNLNQPTEIHIDGDNLYISDFGDNKVLKADLSVTPPVVSDYVTNVNAPTGLFTVGDDLYIGLFGDNKIVKYSEPKSVCFFTQKSVTVNEGDGSLTVEVGVTNPPSEQTQIDIISGIQSSAVYQLDYLRTASAVVFPANSTATQTLTINLIDDQVIESTETLNLILTTTSGDVLLGSDSTMVITIEDNDLVNNDELIELMGLRTWPSPASDWVTIEMNETGTILCTIMDAQGSQIKSEYLSQQTTRLNVQDLSPGLYHIIFKKDNLRAIQKLIIAR